MSATRVKNIWTSSVAATAVLALAATACGSSNGGPDAALDGAGVTVDGGGATDATPGQEARDTQPEGGSPTDRFAEVDRLVREAMNRSSLPGLGLIVRDAKDRVVFSQTYGDFAFDRMIGVASASKLVAGLVLLALVQEGKLSLDSTTGAVLGWSPPKAAITLRHLLSFTSGLRPEAPCTAAATVTLAACVDRIRDAELVAAPGTRFDYGSTHLHVAGRMAEVATGRAWNDIFTEILARPLGFPPDVAFFTYPRQALGRQNPLVAGGLRITTHQYMELLAVAFHFGKHGPLAIGNADLFAQQTREPFPNATIGLSPALRAGHSYRYGLAAWLECPEPAKGCPVVSSPGAFGFTPWFDREAGYHAAIAMELDNMEGGVVKASLDLEQALQPAIKAALLAP